MIEVCLAQLQSLEKKINGLRAVGTRQAEEKLVNLNALLTQLQDTGIAGGGQGEDSSDEDRTTPRSDQGPLDWPTSTVSFGMDTDTEGPPAALGKSKKCRGESKSALSRAGEMCDDGDILTNILGSLVQKKHAGPSSHKNYGQQSSSAPHSAGQDQITNLLAQFVRRSLFQHEIHTCFCEEHTACLRRFDSFKGAAIFIFEIDAAGVSTPLHTFLPCSQEFQSSSTSRTDL